MGCSYFHNSKENGTGRLISDFRELNNTIKKKPKPIAKSSSSTKFTTKYVTSHLSYATYVT